MEKTKKTVSFRNTKVKLNGKPFVIGVDTFDGGDWLERRCKTNNEAIHLAQIKGGTMFKMHAYDKNGDHIGEGGTF